MPLPTINQPDPLPTQIPDDNTTGHKRKRRRTKKNRNAQSHANRKQKREETETIAYCQDPEVFRRYHANPSRFNYAEVVDATAVNTEELTPSATGYVGKSGEMPEPRAYSLEELVGEGSMGFTLLPHVSRCVDPYVDY